MTYKCTLTESLITDNLRAHFRWWGLLTSAPLPRPMSMPMRMPMIRPMAALGVPHCKPLAASAPSHCLLYLRYATVTTALTRRTNSYTVKTNPWCLRWSHICLNMKAKPWCEGMKVKFNVKHASCAARFAWRTAFVRQHIVAAEKSFSHA